tara:strand:+ start:622 stop:2550 length:1929 start_codon:yes stop_codon:yes gene_type:complete
MDPKLLSAIGAAGAAGGGPIGVEDVFKTYLYKGNDSARSINTGVDMTGGGLTWIKARDVTDNHILVDTERGVNKPIFTSASNAESTLANSITAFNNNGFSLGSAADVNWNNKEYVSFNFKKQEKFFTIKSYTGTGSNRTLSHDLGSVPGFILIKNIDENGTDWLVYHRSVGATKGLLLNHNNSASDQITYFNDTEPTSTEVSLGSSNEGNKSGANYIMYLFGHEEAEFGPNSDQKITSCGVYTGNGSSTGPEITLPFEPALVLVKTSDSNESWYLQDSMRGSSTVLFPNRTDAESGGGMQMTSTGFKITTSSGGLNGNLQTHTYIAIAAETGKTSKVPENGTDVFGMDHGNGSSTNFPNFDSTFPVDLALVKLNQTTGTGAWYLSTRISEGSVRTDTDGQASSSSWAQFDSNVGWALSDSYGASSSFSHMWKRYAGLDCLHHTGTGSAGTISHSLGQTPEMIWIKRRDFWQGQNWVVGHKGLNGGTNPWNYYLVLNGNNAEGAQSAYFNDTAPTSSVFTVGTAGGVNASGSPFTIILFSSVEGISKVSSYTGSGGTNQTINVGFDPRFLCIKRASGTGNWRVFDTTRGWDGTNAHILEFDTSDAETDGTQTWVLKTSTGFTLNTYIDAVNGSGSEYIYYCHA